MLIILHYFLFGLCVQIIAVFIKNDVFKIQNIETVSLIIAAYNEEKIIEEKIKNCLTLDYPKQNLEIIIISDGSNDQTESIVKKYKNSGIISMHRNIRKGKTDALNRAVAVAKNDIVIFSDANSMFESKAIKKLIRHFSNEKIGGVCGKKTISSNKTRKAALGDRLYWVYESHLKAAESKLGSIPSGDGEIFAIRKNLYKEIDPQIINDDLAITLEIVSSGKRVIYDSEAITVEDASISFKDDFNVKARMVYGALQILSKYKKLTNPFRSYFGLQFFIHKTLRYFMWLILIILFTSNYFLISISVFYQTFFILQAFFYFFAFIGFILDTNQISSGIFYLPYYYCNVNLAALKGTYYFLKQSPTVQVWTKARR